MTHIQLTDAQRAIAPDVAAYVSTCMTAGDLPAVRNVQTDLRVLLLGEHAFPVSINDGGVQENSYVVSPLTAYSTYAEAELPKLQQPWLEAPLRGVVRGLGRFLERREIDRIVQVNNWLLSTNLYPPGWSGEEARALVDFFIGHFPAHTLGLRSLNPVSNGPLMSHLAAAGFRFIPSRQVYLFDATQGTASDFFSRHNTVIDRGLLRKTPYLCVPGEQLQPSDFLRLEHLYNLLYLEKYSRLNPQFTADWLAAAHRDGWLKLLALRHPEGRIDAVVGWFCTREILTTPIVGYDTALPQKLGLYRLITALTMEEAARRRVLMNHSSGASGFKRLRGGVPCIEYSAVYIRHLPAARRRAWELTGGLLRSVGVPIMKAFKL